MIAAVIGVLLGPFADVRSAAGQAQVGQNRLVDFLPTPISSVYRMLELADVGEEDMVVDLGSGDGRIPIMAATRYGARGIGYEIDPELVERSRTNARRAGVSDRVTIRKKDLLMADLTEATVVTLFLSEQVNERACPRLVRDLPAGAPIISFWHPMGDWQPDTVITVPVKQNWADSAKIYRWYVPKEPEPGVC